MNRHTWITLLFALLRPLTIHAQDAIGTIDVLIREVYIKPLEIPDPILTIETELRPGELPHLFHVHVGSQDPCQGGPITPQLDVTVAWSSSSVSGFAANGPLVRAQERLSAAERERRRELSIRAIVSITGWRVVRMPRPDPKHPGDLIMWFESPDPLGGGVGLFVAPAGTPTMVGKPL